jgi:hypothetical protein
MVYKVTLQNLVGGKALTGKAPGMQCSQEMEQEKEDALNTPRLCLDGIFPLGEVNLLLLLLLGLERSLVLGELSADGTGGLGSKVQRNVLLVLIKEPAEGEFLLDRCSIKYRTSVVRAGWR